MFEKILTWIENRAPAPHGPLIISIIRDIYTKLQSDGANGKSARAAMLVFCVRIISAVLAFVLQVILARWIGTTQYGVFVLVWVTATILGCLSCFGLQTAVIRFVIQYRTKQDGAHLRGVLFAAPTIAIAASIATAAFCFLMLFLFGDYIENIYLLPLYLILISLPFLAMEEIQEGIARSYDMPLTAIGPVFILRPIAIIVIMAIAYQMGYPPDAMTALTSAVVATSLVTLLQGLILWGRILRQNRVEFLATDEVGGSSINQPKFNFQIGHWLWVSLPIFMASGFYSLLLNVDVIFIGYFLDPHSVALYFAAVKSLALVHFVHFALRTASAHHFSRYFAQDDLAGLSRYMLKITQWTFWPTLVLALMMVFMGKYILILFGEEFVEMRHLLAILAIGIVGRSAIGPAESLLSMTGQQSVAMFVLATTLISNIVLNISLIPIYGAVGAAIATSTAMFIETAALYIAIYRKLGLHAFVFGSVKIAARKEYAA